MGTLPPATFSWTMLIGRVVSRNVEGVGAIYCREEEEVGGGRAVEEEEGGWG